MIYPLHARFLGSVRAAGVGLGVALLLVAAARLFAEEPRPLAETPSKNEPAKTAPFHYLWGQAHHILPETTSDESGYFSLCEGHNGKIHVGTAKYNANAYLVEFDPATEKQRVVLDVNKTCGLTASGYAAQAKLHTRNFVGESGVIYVGSKQGYRLQGDASEYPGGYLLTYDPRTDKAENLGMPLKGQGVIDATAHEARGLIYVVTCEDQHWVAYSTKSKTYRELGPMLAPYMTTLVDAGGRAHAITRDFRLATHDPDSDQVTTRDVTAGDRRLTADDVKLGPITWVLAPDGKSAWLIRMSEPTLWQIDLASGAARDHGRMLAGKGFDSRGSLTLGPDGRVYCLMRVDNQTGFGGGYLHHLVRFDPASGRHADLGVLAVRNPEFYGLPLDARGAIDPTTGKARPWTHGFHKLPDGALTPLHAHMALIVARDGTAYATIIYPFTLLRLEGVTKLGDHAPAP